MESLDPECTKLKQTYEACFNSWYSEKYLKGDTKDDCAEIFKEYRACIEVWASLMVLSCGQKVLRTKKIDHLLEEHYRLTNRSEREEL